MVIYSMATSSADEAPRGLDFLYDPHRLNVPTSRARALAIIVASPDLIRVSCRTPHQMILGTPCAKPGKQAAEAAETRQSAFSVAQARRGRQRKRCVSCLVAASTDPLCACDACYYLEVASVESCDLVQVKPLGKRYHAGINSLQPQGRIGRQRSDIRR